MKFGFGILLSLCILASCNSKIGKWENDLRSYITSCDSTHFLLNNQIDSTELEEVVENSSIIWNQTKPLLIGDTLDPETLKILDAFNTSYSNTKLLVSERNKCNEANQKLRSRLSSLLEDLEQGNGDRSTFCSSIQHEKDELTIIRNHAIDIHRRFEELKSSKKQFESTFARL